MTLKEILQASGALYPDITPKGWECPKCGRVYSPSTPMCYYCGGANTVTVTTGSIGLGTGRPFDHTGGEGIGEVTERKCDTCPIAATHNLEDDDSPCLDCGEE